jgi:hypothetical protein
MVKLLRFFNMKSGFNEAAILIIAIIRTDEYETIMECTIHKFESVKYDGFILKRLVVYNVHAVSLLICCKNYTC